MVLGSDEDPKGGSIMERMLVVVFDNEKKAFEGRSALRQLELEDSISIYAGAVVLKHADGTVSVKQLDDDVPVGTSSSSCFTLTVPSACLTTTAPA
jgi:uncharacterized membrane protein